MAIQHYLVITDGTDTVTIADGAGGATDYKLQHPSWAPNVAGRRRSQLGGRGPYEDVAEKMDLIISGATVPAVLANVAKLARLLDKAERWSRGENVSAVLIKFSPKDGTVSSAANPLQAVIVGRAAGDQTVGMKLPDTIGELNSNNLYVTDVQVRFVRRGLWLHTSDNVTVNTVTNGDIATFAMTEARTVPAPINVLVGMGYGKSATSRYHGGFVLIGEPVLATIPIVVINSSTAATGAPWTNVADAGRNALGGTVLRYTPTVTTEVASPTVGGATLPVTADLVSIFANVRPHTTTNFLIRARVDSQIYNQFTPPVAVAASATQYPRWIYLGTVPKKIDVAAIYLYITASAAAGNLDIDTVVVCDARATQVLAIVGPSDSDLNSSDTNGTVSINHQLLTKPAPAVVQADRPLPYSADAVIATEAATLYGLLLATGGGTGTSGDEWRQANIATDAVLTGNWTIQRSRAYLVPE